MSRCAAQFVRRADTDGDEEIERELNRKAHESGANDIRRSIRERKRRMRVNLLEKEIARLALTGADADTRSSASKCQILERACAALGSPVVIPPMPENMLSEK